MCALFSLTRVIREAYLFTITLILYMAVISCNGKYLIVRLEIELSEIPCLLDSHRDNYQNHQKKSVEELQDDAVKLIDNGFNAKKSRKFVEEVCEWGGGQRLIKRIIDNNTDEKISSALHEGCTKVQKGCVPEGVERIQCLKGLGLSFASKMLRFLAPDCAVILDRVIRTQLGYEETCGYSEFLGDCQALLRHAKKSEELDAEFKQGLRVCDIEAALYAKIQIIRGKW